MTGRTRLAAAIGTLVALAVAAALVWLQVSGPGSISDVGGPFRLTDQTGKTRTDAEFRGKLMLIYFGYTNCPDLCPTALNDMSLALDTLGPAAESVQPIFITIDPERDTVEKLSTYVSFFHPRLIGLTGSPEEIDRVARAYHISYRRVSDPEFGYQMEHSSVIYLMGRDGRYVTHFPHFVSVEEMAAALRKAVAAEE